MPPGVKPQNDSMPLSGATHAAKILCSTVY